MNIREAFPDPDALLALEPEELAGYLLQQLVSATDQKHGQGSIAADWLVENYPQNKKEPCKRAVMEAWSQLLSNGLLAPEPGNNYPVYFVTRRGHKIADRERYAEFLHTRLFPRDSLHEDVRSGTYELFLREDYEAAVFQAFKRVEIAVREACSFDVTVLGVDLMRKAFDPEAGPLSDPDEPKAEREALAHLFAGAIGRFKNPSSHRHVALTDPVEAVEMIQFASHLRRIVSERSVEA